MNKSIENIAFSLISAYNKLKLVNQKNPALLEKIRSLKPLFILFFILCFEQVTFSQNVGIGTATPEAKVDITSSNTGVLIPRVSLSNTSSPSPLTDPTVGELVFNTSSSGTGETAVAQGFYFWNGTGWYRLKGGTFDADHDWYKEGIIFPATSINENIYTNGNIGIGEEFPDERLSIYVNDNIAAEIGHAHIGYVGNNNWAGFSHMDMITSFTFALLQNNDGRTLVNSASGEDILIRNNDELHSVFDASGQFGVGTTDPDSKVEVVGDIRMNDNDASIIYENTKETNKDWRLVSSDNFTTGSTTKNWIAENSSDPGTTQDGYSTTITPNVVWKKFISPTNNNNVLKKQFNFSELEFSEVKVQFNYLFIDSWDSESGWLGVKSTPDGMPVSIWYRNHTVTDIELNGTNTVSNITGNDWSDFKIQGEAFFSWDSDIFWLEFGANLDDDSDNETFGIDNIMIYVR